MKKLLLALGLTCGGLYVIYVVGVSVALRNGVLQKLSADWEDAKMRAASGSSFWPGTFHLTDASVSFKDYNIEVQVSAAEVEVDVAVWSTIFGSAHIEGVRATGAKYRMLHRVKDGYSNRKRLPAYPDIEGFNRSPVYNDPKPPYTPLSRPIRVENIEGEVLEAWFLEYRAVGKMHARGGFEIFREVRVLPSSVTFDDVDIFVGRTQFVQHARCDLSSTIGPFDRKTGGLLDVLAVTNGQINCEAPIADLSVAEIYMPDFPAQVVGTGKWTSAMQIEQGRIIKSKAELHAKFEPVRLAGNALSGELHTALDADATGVLKGKADWSGTKQQEELTPAKEVFVAQLKEAHVAGTWEQRQLYQLTPRDVVFDVSGLSWFDPVFLRNLLAPHPPQAGKETDGGFVLNKVEDVSLSGSYQDPEAKDPALQDAQLSARASGAVVLFPGEGQQLSCITEAKLACRLRPNETTCSEAQMNCKPLSVTVTNEEKSAVTEKVTVKEKAAAKEKGVTKVKTKEEITPLETSVATNDLRFTSDVLTTTIAFRASNPRSLIDALADPDLLGQLGLAVLPFGVLEGSVSIHSEQGTILGKVPAFTSGGLRGRGSFVIATAVESLWSIETPLGRFGVEQTPAGVSLNPFIGEDWLEEQTKKQAQ